MAADIEVVPQPRIDLLVDDVSGTRRRRTEYSGTVWFGGRPQDIGHGAMIVSRGAARIDTPFFLPDSLPYRADALTDATLAVTVAVESFNDYASLIDKAATFVLDPRGAPCWVQLQIVASSRIPLGVSYRVIATTAPDAVDTA